MKHFFISFVVVKGYNRDSIIDLESEAVDAVVNDDDVLEVTVVEDAEVLDVVAFAGEVAVLAIESVFYVFVVGVYVVEDGICVDLVARGEDYDLEVLAGFFEALHDIRPYVDASVDCFLVWEIDFKYYIWVLGLDVIHTMDQGLVHVEDHEFFLYN